MSFGLPPHPYPPDRYTRDEPEVSARLRRADAAPDSESDTTATHYLTTGASTKGDYGLYRWDMKGPPSGPGPHFHRSLSESFFVLSGAIELYDGAKWITGKSGDFLYVPEGGVHGFRNESGEPASMLILFAPGAPREAYFEGLVERATMAIKPSEAEMAEFYLTHDTFWVAGGE